MARSAPHDDYNFEDKLPLYKIDLTKLFTVVFVEKTLKFAATATKILS